VNFLKNYSVKIRNYPLTNKRRLRRAFLASGVSILYYSSTICRMKRTRTSSRKQQHVELALTKDVSFRAKSAGFDRWEFLHNALPELDLSDVDPSTRFLGKPVALPVVVSSMTGGYPEATRINRQLAEVCAQLGLAMGVGSQRQALEDRAFHRSFSVVREAAPDIPVFGNIGAVEVARMRTPDPVLRLIDLIRADGFAVHLNPVQEFLQPEGDPRFRGVLEGIAMLVRALPVPVIVKEVGSGISAEVARRLMDVGIRWIDVAGAGGTSWAAVEIHRRRKPRTLFTGDVFWDWGIPTAEAIRSVSALRAEVPELGVIGSGGIRSGLDGAKALALGANLVGVARPFLQALHDAGPSGLRGAVEVWAMELKGTMFLAGARTLDELRRKQLIQCDEPLL